MKSGHEGIGALVGVGALVGAGALIRCLVLALGLVLSGLGCAGSESAQGVVEVIDVDIGGPTIPALVREEVAPPAPKPKPGDLAFLDWAASHCYVDELGPSPYAVAWQRYHADRDGFGPDAILPALDIRLPRHGSPAARERASALRKAWRDEPESHVLDCRFIVPVRRCAGCRGPRMFVAHYVAYLPREIVTDPARIGSLLMLVPGGNGGRTRPFLSPVPGKTIFHRGSGGLETRQIVDRHLAAHPELTPPIVVALETAGAEYNNGSVEHLTHDLPGHIADTYLDRDASTLVLGIEGVSSGARSILEASFAKPGAFATLGLTGMACGRLVSESGIGSPPLVVARAPHTSVQKEEVVAWARQLGARAAADELFVRFSIGDRDGQLPCSRTLHQLFVEAGVIPRTPPKLLGCHGTDGGPPCDREESSFALYEGEMHHYGIVAKSHAAQLRWHLEALSRAAQARADG